MDLKKELSFGKQKSSYPTKTSINLIGAASSSASKAKTILLFILFLAVLALFAKFGIVDQIASVTTSSREVEAAQKELDAYKQKNANSAEITDRYARYIIPNITDEEKALVSRSEITDLLRTRVMGVATLSEVKVVDNTVTITCLGMGLQEASAIVLSIEQDERVAHATIATAQDKDGDAAYATISVTMKDAAVLAEERANSANLVDTASESVGQQGTSDAGENSSAEEGGTNG